MAAQNNEAMKAAVVTLKKLSAEEKIQLECEAREMYEHDMASIRETVEMAMKEMQNAKEEAQNAREEAQSAREEAQSARRKGFEEGTTRANQLILLLAQQNRMEDIIQAAGDSKYQAQLFAEFNL